MTLYDFLEEATASIDSNGKASEVRRELYVHFLMKVEDLVREGMDPKAAEAHAFESLGDPREIAEGYRPAYAIRMGSGASRWYFLASIPLVGAALATVRQPSYAIVWLVLSTALAGVLARGTTWQQRVQALVCLIRNVPLLWTVGMIGGTAAAIGTDGTRSQRALEDLWWQRIRRTGIRIAVATIFRAV